MNLPMRRPLPAAVPGLRLPGALLLGILLAACAGPHVPEVAQRERVDGASLSRPMAPAGTATPAAPATPAPGLAAMPVPAPAAPPGRRWSKAPKPSAIIDHPGATVQTLLGDPALRRREPPAEVWQYSGAGCVLDITFYPGKDGGPARAAYLESRSLDGAAMEPAACLNGMDPGRR